MMLKNDNRDEADKHSWLDDAPAAPPDPEAWPEIESIAFASVEDRKKCEKLLREWNSKPTAPCPLVEGLIPIISIGIRKYRHLFVENIYGTEKQVAAMLELVRRELEAWEASQKEKSCEK